MQQSWDRTSSIESVKTSHTKMLGKGQSGGYPPETTGELLQSISAIPVDCTDKKGLQVGGQLPGSVQAVPQQQNQQLLLTPASLQLAQLQAQLTLHRLKLAQGGNTATAATVLNQVLSNVAMSQPLFNQLRTSTMVGNPQGAFPTGVLGFPSSNSALGALVGAGYHQNPGNVRLNHPGGGGTVGQQGAEYGKKSGSAYPSDTDRRLQYNLVGGTSAASATASDEHYTVINTQAKNMNNVGFQRDFYGQDIQGQQAGFSVNEQNINVYNSPGQKEQWKGPSSMSHTGKMDMVSNAATVWTAAGQPIRSQTELYNPEEPTPDPKFNHSSGGSSLGSSGTQGFGGYQPLHGSEETRTLQPYQVNDYHAITPTQLPHQCSICDKKVYNLKDWDQHVKGKLHLQNRTLYTNESSAVVSAGAVHYAVSRPSDGGLKSGGTNSMVYSAASQDVSSGANTSYLPAAAMKTYPMSDTGFASHQPESKPFPPRKATVGRVVHICNLPEGSCTENDVINLGLPFGKVTNYILMRSTHQAFLEMAYVEAAQAMVQYYQLTPAMISNQKLLIRMSKRYKELQLKKPGKDVQTIIHDINSQRERDEMQELEHYIPERARSRSPISRSLSPHSHSPSFTSCSSAHSPQGAPCRGPERSNGFGPCRGSWDWSSHLRRGEDERERDDPWRNGGSVDDDRPNGRGADRRKAYQKPMDHISSRSADERGGGEDRMRGNRDWHPRGSPQGMSFNTYRNMEDDFYMKEQMYKSDKPPRPPYQRHDTKPKRRDGGDYHGRPRHSEFEMSEEPLCRTPEEKRQSSPGRGRSKKTSRRHTTAEKHERENATENTDRQSKEKSVSPQRNNKPKEATECSKDRETEKEWESGVDTDEECWYPKNMEELVTVDEVGGEDDSIIEPDLPELEEYVSCPKESAQEEAVEKHESPPAQPLEEQETFNKKSNQEESRGAAGDQAETSVTEKAENVLTETSHEEQKPSQVTPELPTTNLSDFPSEEFKAALEEACLEDKVTNCGPSEEPMENHRVLEDSKTQEVGQVTEIITNGAQLKDDILKKEMEAPSPSREQDKAVSEHSIPLGVEFIVPRTGFYCKLCGLFYTSEENAKTIHCRSTVHYRNLQKYLSQLAEESLSDTLSEPSAAQ
ncbi:RNA-binding protein 20 [Seriola aureovittata]|uniref:RNA-binding protein 20 n=1 Tax=Seriola aureovittata TaxID=2871759 RepID=UPI0024BD6FDE|nr:RNA-binding protein 20 [Seriola aureovittata]